MPSPHPQPVRGGPTSTPDAAFARDLIFDLKGRRVYLTDISPAPLLVAYVRSKGVGLTGTKIGCKQGGCGACAALLSHYDPVTNSDWAPSFLDQRIHAGILGTLLLPVTIIAAIFTYAHRSHFQTPTAPPAAA
jgi:hypothetical protein